MRRRPSARLLLLDDQRRVLLFRFVPKASGQAFWATPGGALDPSESFEQAALRELREETGIVVDRIGAPVASRRFTMTMPDGEPVLAEEQLFLLHAPPCKLSRDGWTALEREVMVDHRWWTADELRRTSDTVWPADLTDILASAGAW